MGFKVSNNSINISVNTFSNVGGNNKNTFKLTSYDDIGEIDYSQYAPVQQNVDFSVAAGNLGFTKAQLKEIYTWKDFTLDLIGFHEKIQNFWTRTAATVGNLTVSLVEGLVSFAEAIVDCAALLVGGVATIGTGLWDLGVGIFTGNWDWSATGAMWKKGFMPFVGFDATSVAFDWVYEKTPMKQVNEAAWEWGQRGGTAYSIGKGVGYYTGVIAVSAFTAGAAGVATSATTQVAGVAVNTTSLFTGGFMAAGKMAQSTQSGYNQLVASGEDITMGDIGTVLGKSAVKGIIDGGTYIFGANVTSIPGVKNAMNTIINKIPKSSNEVVNKVVGDVVKKEIQAVAKSTKALTSETANWLMGEEFSWLDVAKDAGATFISENAAIAFGSIKTFASSASNTKVSTEAVMAENPLKDNSDLSKLVSQAAATDTPAKDSSTWLKNLIDNIKSTETGKNIVQSVNKGSEKGVEKMIKEVTKEVYEGVLSSDE